jgi:deoxyribonuclease V
LTVTELTAFPPRWPTSPRELIEAQLALASAAPEPWQPPRDTPAIGACVVVFPRGMTGRGQHGDPAWAAATVMLRRRVVGEAGVDGVAAGPYVPGMLALREGPPLEAAVRALPALPDVLLVDATGRDHPRRAGLASHLGAVIGVPTIGVTHRPLLARGAWPADARGAHAPLSIDDDVVAAWLRTRRGARPVVVHPGWRTTLDDAIDVVSLAALGHRTPEALRHARHLARIARANG